MADMIDAKEASKILGCDEATLNAHINKGSIRANRSGGKLLVNRDDVEKVAKEDDATIVLTGESDNLQIDLGAVDESAATMVQDKPFPETGKTAKGGTDSITFADELEVISFDDPPAKTGPTPSVKPSPATAAPLEFTDQNTAVMTAVDDAAIYGTTGPLDTSNENNPAMATATSSDSRRSVRSNRVRIDVKPTPLWVVGVMATTTLVLALLVLPYHVLALWPRSDDVDAAGNQARGIDDGVWSGMAAMVAGFTVEPSAKRFTQVHGSEATHIPNPDVAAEFRIEKYRSTFKGDNERRESFIIEKISDDGKYAIAKGEKAKYPIVKRQSAAGAGIEEDVVDLGLTQAK